MPVAAVRSGGDNTHASRPDTWRCIMPIVDGFQGELVPPPGQSPTPNPGAEDWQAEATRLQAECLRLRDEGECRQRERDTARRELQDLRADFERHQAGWLRTRDDLEVLRAELRRLERDGGLDGPSPAVTDLTAELAELRAEAFRLKQELIHAEQRGRAEAARTRALEADLARAREENRRLQGKLAEARPPAPEAADPPAAPAAESEPARTEDRPPPRPPAAPRPRRPAAAPAPPPADNGRRFATVAEALAAAGDEFADVLSVWDSAAEAAGQSDGNQPDQVFRALQAIAEVGRLYFQARQAGRSMGPLDRALRSRVPFKYSGTESPTTLSMFGGARVFRHRGQSRRILKHLTLNRGDRRHCVQIYFEFDDDSRRVLVGYCGRHLPISRQPT
jgi:hypothetical protein